MQTLTDQVFKLGPPGGFFTETVIRNLFPALSEGAARLLLHRAVRAGEVLRIKRGLYCLSEPYRRTTLHPYAVAGMLHSPSHVSCESALSHHGLIPEAVYQVSSVTSRRSRTFSTPLGVFTFQRVPCNQPRAGVMSVSVGGDAWAFVASPLRAIADTVYLRKSVRWHTDGLTFLTESMRIEESDLQEMSWADFDDIFNSLRNRRTREYLAGMKKDIGS